MVVSTADRPRPRLRPERETRDGTARVHQVDRLMPPAPHARADDGVSRLRKLSVQKLGWTPCSGGWSVTYRGVVRHHGGGGEEARRGRAQAAGRHCRARGWLKSWPQPQSGWRRPRTRKRPPPRATAGAGRDGTCGGRNSGQPDQADGAWRRVRRGGRGRAVERAVADAGRSKLRPTSGAGRRGRRRGPPSITASCCPTFASDVCGRRRGTRTIGIDGTDSITDNRTHLKRGRKLNP